jgi:molecular chaperone GrpE
MKEDNEEFLKSGTDDPQLANTSNSGDSDDIQDELKKAIAQAEENLGGWKRTQADFENYRKRKDSESMEWMSIGKQKAFEYLLPAIDSLWQALTYAPQIEDPAYKQWRSGLGGIVKQLDAALESAGVKKIDAIGKDFDPNKHEAVRELPGKEDGKIVEQYQLGYEIDNRVIRPAQVAISKKE